MRTSNRRCGLSFMLLTFAFSAQAGGLALPLAFSLGGLEPLNLVRSAGRPILH
jgi:hypothetical protein